MWKIETDRRKLRWLLAELLDGDHRGIKAKPTGSVVSSGATISIAAVIARARCQ